jgi:nitroimidazol reductase NimA-like FMN-containing flavoprotein (pyridoxamine 5'-phosphate oxidase superfamily)
MILLNERRREMIEVLDLSDSEITEVLERVGYAHLACCVDGKPYVVPVHYGFSEGNIFIYTTEGKKADIIAKNAAVCLQIEDVVDNRNWKSVIVDGEAVKLERGEERDRALNAVVAVNPTLTPAVSIRWLDEWVRENVEVIYRIDVKATSGRRSLDRSSSPPIIPGRSGHSDLDD